MSLTIGSYAIPMAAMNGRYDVSPASRVQSRPPETENGNQAVEKSQASPNAEGVPQSVKPAEEKNGNGKKSGRYDKNECQTCKNRTYQDGSNDPGVSFKTPGKIDPNAAASKVRSHEMEHVSRNQAKAAREGREVVSQTVTLHNGVCPECGRSYVSGGTTRTVTRSKAADQYKAMASYGQKEEDGSRMNLAA